MKIIDKYQDLAREMKKLWKTTIVFVVIGALGLTSKMLPKRLKAIGMETDIVNLQKKYHQVFCKNPK